MKNVAALWLASALLLAASAGVAAEKKGKPAPPSADAFAPFLGSWYRIVKDCQDCEPLPYVIVDPEDGSISQPQGPGLYVRYLSVKQNGQKINVVLDREKMKNARLENDALHFFDKLNHETWMTRTSQSDVRVEYTDDQGLHHADVFNNDPAPLKEALARHANDGGGKPSLFGEIMGALAQGPLFVPQTRIPQQTASAPPAQPRYPGGQTAGGAAPQYPVAQPVGGATSQQQQSVGGSSSSSEGPSSASAHPVDAGDFNRCISVQEQPNGNVGLVNRCNQNMNVHFCVANANYPMGLNCASGGGLDSASANGGFLWLPEYKNSGGGRIYWGACAAPIYPQNWQQTGSTYSFQCR